MLYVFYLEIPGLLKEKSLWKSQLLSRHVKVNGLPLRA